MEDFLEITGVIFLIILFVAVFTVPVAVAVNAGTNDLCVSNGYSKYTEKLGETYCLEFIDGIISGIGLLDSDKGTVTALGIGE